MGQALDRQRSKTPRGGDNAGILGVERLAGECESTKWCRPEPHPDETDQQHLVIAGRSSAIRGSAARVLHQLQCVAVQHNPAWTEIPRHRTPDQWGDAPAVARQAKDPLALSISKDADPSRPGAGQFKGGIHKP